MSLVATLVQDSRVRAEFDKFEMLIENAGILNTFLKQTDAPGGLINAKLKEKAFLSAGSAVHVPVFNFKDVTIRNTRPLTISADENTSALIDLTWVTLGYGIVMYPAQHYNNDMTMQDDFDWKFKAMMRKMIKTLEGLGGTTLNAAKNQVQPELVGGHTWSSDVFHETGIGNLKESYMLSDIDGAMASLDLDGMGFDIVGNQGLRSIAKRLAGYSTYNSENKRIMLDGNSLQWSNQITNASTKKATGYAIMPGSLGFMTRVEPDSVLRTKLGTSHEWDIINLPMIGRVGTYAYDAAVNAATLAPGATDHLTRTGAKIIDFAVDVCFATTYNSDIANIAAPILKFDIDTA